MKIQDKASLLILCGALHDIWEKMPSGPNKRQLNTCRLKMERVIDGSMPIASKVQESDTTMLNQGSTAKYKI